MVNRKSYIYVYDSYGSIIHTLYLLDCGVAIADRHKIYGVTISQWTVEKLFYERKRALHYIHLRTVYLFMWRLRLGLG